MVIGIIESKIGNSVPDTEVKIQCYCIFWCDRSRNLGGVACYIRKGLCCNLRSTVMGDVKCIFLDILAPKRKSVSVGKIYRTQRISSSWKFLRNTWMIPSLIM